MPNGGSDCCATCWFNAKNEFPGGHEPTADSASAFCSIRCLPIDDPYYTYCCNHPHRRPDRDPIPIGPVFTGGSSGDREIWVASPDTEDVRKHLLILLSQIEEQPDTEYPIGIYTDEMVVWQLGEFREERAAIALRRVCGFNPSAAEAGPFQRTRESLIRLAQEALEKTGENPVSPP